jgi:hypothetical protein
MSITSRGRKGRRRERDEERDRGVEVIRSDVVESYTRSRYEHHQTKKCHL